MGLIKGSYGGRSDEFQPGGMSYECGFVPHGVDYPTWKAATQMKLEPQWISEGTIGAASFAFRVEMRVLMYLHSVHV